MLFPSLKLGSSKHLRVHVGVLQPHLAVGHMRLVLCVGVSMCVRVMVPQTALGAGLTFQPRVDPAGVG